VSSFGQRRADRGISAHSRDFRLSFPNHKNLI